MISYRPLAVTLQKKGMGFDELQRRLGNYSLREKMNRELPVSFGTLDAICRELECGVEDVIKWEDREREEKEWTRGCEVDWGIVYDMIKGRNKNFCRASQEMGMKGSYLGNLSLSAVTSRKVVQRIASYLECDIEKFAKEIKR